MRTTDAAMKGDEPPAKSDVTNSLQLELNSVFRKMQNRHRPCVDIGNLDHVKSGRSVTYAAGCRMGSATSGISSVHPDVLKDVVAGECESRPSLCTVSKVKHSTGSRMPSTKDVVTADRSRVSGYNDSLGGIHAVECLHKPDACMSSLSAKQNGCDDQIKEVCMDPVAHFERCDGLHENLSTERPNLGKDRTEIDSKLEIGHGLDVNLNENSESNRLKCEGTLQEGWRGCTFQIRCNQGMSEESDMTEQSLKRRLTALSPVQRPSGSSHVLGHFGSPPQIGCSLPGSSQSLRATDPFGSPKEGSSGHLQDQLPCGSSQAIQLVRSSSSLRSLLTRGTYVFSNRLESSQTQISSGTEKTQGFSGSKQIQRSSGSKQTNGSSGFKQIQGSSESKQIQGSSWSKQIQGSSGSKQIQGSSGSKQTNGSSGFKQIQGSSASKQIQGSSESKQIQGSSWSKQIQGSSGSKQIQGSSGSKQIQGSSGSKQIQGSSGSKQIQGSSGSKQIQGSSGSKQIQGSSGSKQIQGSSGSKQIQGSSGSKQIQGSSESKQIQGSSWSKQIQGSSGSKQIQGSSGSKQTNGSSGFKQIQGSSASKQIQGSSESKQIQGSSWSKQIQGSSGSKQIQGSSGSKQIQGSSGSKQIQGSSESKQIEGSSESKQIQGSSESKQIEGSSESKQIQGSSESKQIEGSSESKQIQGSSESKQIEGSSESKQIQGSSESKQIEGSSESKQIQGSSESKQIQGSSESKQIEGSAESKQIQGSSESKQIQGSSESKQIEGSSPKTQISSGANKMQGYFESSNIQGSSQTIRPSTSSQKQGSSGSKQTVGSSGYKQTLRTNGSAPVLGLCGPSSTFDQMDVLHEEVCSLSLSESIDFENEVTKICENMARGDVSSATHNSQQSNTSDCDQSHTRTISADDSSASGGYIYLWDGVTHLPPGHPARFLPLTVGGSICGMAENVVCDPPSGCASRNGGNVFDAVAYMKSNLAHNSNVKSDWAHFVENESKMLGCVRCTGRVTRSTSLATGAARSDELLRSRGGLRKCSSETLKKSKHFGDVLWSESGCTSRNDIQRSTESRSRNRLVRSSSEQTSRNKSIGITKEQVHKTHSHDERVATLCHTHHSQKRCHVHESSEVRGRSGRKLILPSSHHVVAPRQRRTSSVHRITSSTSNNRRCRNPLRHHGRSSSFATICHDIGTTGPRSKHRRHRKDARKYKSKTSTSRNDGVDIPDASAATYVNTAAFRDFADFEDSLIRYVHVNDLSLLNDDIRQRYRLHLDGPTGLATVAPPDDCQLSRFRCCFCCHQTTSALEPAAIGSSKLVDLLVVDQ